MEAKSTNRKTFQLTDNGEILGELAYISSLSMKAEIRLANSELYELKPVNFFATIINVHNKGAIIAHIKPNWNGHVLITFQGGQEFVFKVKSLLESKFVIENKDKQKILQIDPHVNWSKLNYNYNISYENSPPHNLLAFLAIYASNYYIDSLSGAVAGV